MAKIIQRVTATIRCPPNLRDREGSDQVVTDEHKARCELHARLRAEHHAILAEHTELQRKPFDGDEHRLHLARLDRHRNTIAASRALATHNTNIIVHRYVDIPCPSGKHRRSIVTFRNHTVAAMFCIPCEHAWTEPTNQPALRDLGLDSAH